MFLAAGRNRFSFRQSPGSLAIIAGSNILANEDVQVASRIREIVKQKRNKDSNFSENFLAGSRLVLLCISCVSF